MGPLGLGGGMRSECYSSIEIALRRHLLATLMDTKDSYINLSYI